ncbi:hypothetical protein RCL1_002065 [Eukaryota sp. TZLM3-RCL]
MAPKVLASKTLPAGWTMIIEEYFALETLSFYLKQDVLKPDQYNNILSNMRLLMQKLHSYGYVHGDFRPSNILIDPLSLDMFLIDFEFSGKQGAKGYYHVLNENICWHSQVKFGAQLQMDHDEFLLNHLEGLFQKASSIIDEPLLKTPSKKMQVDYRDF